MNKCLVPVSLLFLIIFSALSVSYAENGNITVRPVNGELTEAKPRQILTTLFKVTNNTGQIRNLEAEVILPDSWSLITPEFPFTLAPGESEIRLVSFLTSPSSSAGQYKLTYTVKDREFPTIIDSYSVSVIILPVPRLEIQPVSATDYIIAGGTYQSEFRIINRGNVSISGGLQIKSEYNYPVSANLETFTVDPGKSESIIINVKTADNIIKRFRHLLSVTVTAEQDGKEPLLVSTSSQVDVIPRVADPAGTFHRLPARLRLQGVSEHNGKSNDGIQAEFAGSGYLDEYKTEFIDFLFRSPDIDGDSIYGEKDEYRLSLAADNYEIYLGDRTYSLSPLTERFIYGRGLEGVYKNSDLSARAYYMRSLWIKPEKRQAAAGLNFAPNENSKLFLNYLLISSDEDDGSLLNGHPERSEIISIRGKIDTLDYISTDMEVAWGKKDDGSGSGEDTAYHLELSSVRDSYSGRFKLIHAGPDFHGYYNDMDYLSGSLLFKLIDGLKMRADYRQEERNLDLDPARSASRDDYSRLGLFYRFTHGPDISLDYRHRKRMDRMPEPEFDFVEDTYGLSLAHRFNLVGFNVSGEWGKSTDNLTDEESSIRTYRFVTSYKPKRDLSASGFYEYREGSSLYGKKGGDTSLGLRAWLQLSSVTSLELDSRYTDYHSNGNNSTYELRFKHKFENSHLISVRGRYNTRRNSSSHDENGIMASYTIPLHIPVGLKKSVGKVTGRVYDSETNLNMKDVIVRLNGTSAVTDHNGQFSFTSMKPGIYYLRVDAADIGFDRIVDMKAPIALDIRGGETMKVNVPITRGSSIKGRILVYDTDRNNGIIVDDEGRKFILGNGNNRNNRNSAGDGSGRYLSYEKSGGLENIVVIIKNTSEAQRRLTDADGCFEFESIRPGHWTVTVLKANLPEFHYIEKDTYDLNLEPGQQMDIPVKVLPKIRPIIMLEDNGQIIEQKTIK